jgi:putative DNA primase/helicase
VKTLQPITTGIPYELQAIPQWVVFRIEPAANGELTKVPYNPDTGWRASTTNPDTWCSFGRAVAAFETNTRWDGIGFILSENDPLFLIDLDKCRDPETGQVDDWAERIARTFATYTEPSVSGTGLHLIGKGRKPGNRAKQGGGRIEIYDRARFATITGRPLDYGSDGIEDCQNELDALYSELFGVAPESPNGTTPAVTVRALPEHITDEMILEKARSFRTGPEFDALWRGDLSGFNGDHSAADLALCNYLAFVVGPDPARIYSLFSESELGQRDKWTQRADYPRITINKALSDRTWPDDYFPWPDGVTFSTNGLKPPQERPQFARTDTGNAERLVHRYGQDIRFNWGRGIWHVWNGQCWDPDESGRLEQLAKDTVRAIPDEAAGISDDDQRQKVLKWAASSESAGKREAMIRLARSEPGVPVMPDELDSNIWLLNVRNGTLDLRTGDLRPHDRADYITRVIDTEYNPNATCPQFDAFLDTIMGGDQELVEYLWRLMGYSLTGSTREQIVIIAYGHGGNGKSTLLSTFRDLLGDYAREADADSFMEQRGGAIREDIADLDGARFVSASETRDGQRLSEALIKKMTGGERIRARRLYENGYEFLPQFKVWLSTNHKPQIQGTEHAIWRRIRLVPFAVTIPKSEQDPELPAKLRGEWPGILARAVRGCMEWQTDGIGTPKAVQDATNEYREEMDVLSGWIAEECVLGSDKSAPARSLYRSYHNWCEAAGEKPLAQRWFGARLVERGFDNYRTNKSRFWIGIGLKRDEES